MRKGSGILWQLIMSHITTHSVAMDDVIHDWPLLTTIESSNFRKPYLLIMFMFNIKIKQIWRNFFQKEDKKSTVHPVSFQKNHLFCQNSKMQSTFLNLVRKLKPRCLPFFQWNKKKFEFLLSWKFLSNALQCNLWLILSAA